MFKATAVTTALALGIVCFAVPASAQSSCTNTVPGTTCAATTTATLTIPSLISLDLGAGTVALTAPTAASLGAYVQDNGPIITVKSNRTWKLQVHTTNSSNWDYVSGGQAGVKPISDLTWSNTVGGSYSAIGATAADVTTNNARTNGANPTIFFRTLYDASYASDANAAGDYAINLVFTLVAN